MKSASNTLPERPASGVTAGLDWAKDDHAVSIVDDHGREVDRTTVEHSADGLRDLIKTLRRHRAVEVAIERPDGPVVESLLDSGITVVVISPNQVKNLRGRYGSAGNKDDRFDAFVLADTLRTDRARLRPLIPDSDATVALRRACRARKDLIRHRVAAANQLRAHLNSVFPGAVDWLSPKRLATWLAGVSYSGGVDPAVLHARLTAAPRGAVGDHGATEAHVTRALVAVLSTLVDQIKSLTDQIADQLARHADAHIFTSLPRTRTIRAARLLTEIGDCRGRFPTPESLACLAGVAPSTRQSGKLRTVGFRWSCDKNLRDAVCDFAGDSHRANPWAAHLYQRARNDGYDHAHATRILARAWLYVIWHCWQDHTAYDPDQHGALQRLLNQDQQAAA